jgi:hypothetical protein
MYQVSDKRDTDKNVAVYGAVPSHDYAWKFAGNDINIETAYNGTWQT